MRGRKAIDLAEWAMADAAEHDPDNVALVTVLASISYALGATDRDDVALIHVHGGAIAKLCARVAALEARHG